MISINDNLQKEKFVISKIRNRFERSGIDIDPDDISPIYGVQERGILQDGFPVHVIGARFLSNRSLRPISQRVRGNLLLLFLFCH